MALENIEEKKKQLIDLATVLNSFKSEAIQLRLLEYILGDSGGTGADQRTPSDEMKPRSRRKQRKQRESEVDERGGSTPLPKKKAVAPGNGPIATVSQLLEGDFFKKPRTIGAIVDHCKHNLARSFKANDISGKLGQLVRAGQLKREKNADHQYEYKKP